MTIISERLHEIRSYRGLSRKQLAEKSLVSEKQIARIETGQINTTRPNTNQRLAQALEVDIGVLTGEKPLPVYLASEVQPLEVKASAPIGGNFRPELKLAFDLIRHRYGWDVQHIIATAPIMFVLLVERCVLWQRKRMKKLDGFLNNLDEQASLRLREAIDTDAALQDIPAENAPLPEHFRQTFHDYLCALAADLSPDLVEPMVVQLWSAPQGRVCEKYLTDDITGGSITARWALEYGDAHLDDIPEELRSEEAKGERVKWLESQLREETKQMIGQRWATELPVGPRSIEKLQKGGGKQDGQPAGLDIGKTSA